MTITAEGTRPGLASVTGIGLVAGTMEVAVALSFAALLFAGMGPAAYARGAGFILLGSMISNLIVSRWSSLPGALVVPQDTSTAILATAAAPLLAGHGPDMQFSTMLAYAAAAAALTGAVMLFIGLARQGSLIRFIPLPVIGGFLAGTGYLLVVGGADVITSGFDFSASSVVALIGGSLFGLGMLLVLRRWPRPGLVPGSVAVGAVLFFLILLVTGTSIDEARSLGLLMESVRTSIGLPLDELRSADWSILVDGWGGLVTVPLVATLGMLLNVNALEMIGGHDANLDRELRMVGTANLAGVTTGTPAVYHTLGITALGYRVGVRSRLVPIIVALACLAAAGIGGPILAAFPMPVVGGLLIFLGLGFITDWFVDRRRQMTGPEVLLMATIVFAVATLGFLAAVGLGMLASVIIFAIRYAGIDPVRHHGSGSEMRSTVDRPRAAEQVLAAAADRILVVQLHGFLFFGTAKMAVERVADLLSQRSPVEVLVVDLERVTGADATGVSAILKLGALAQRQGAEFVLSSIPVSLQVELAAGMAPEAGVAADLDHALEIAEEIVIGDTTDPDSCTLDEVFGMEVWEQVRPYLERIRVGAGDVVIRVGEKSSGVLMVEEGRLITEIATDRGYRRVRSSGPGAIVGEMSIYRTGGRSARVAAIEPTVLLSLDDEAFAAIEADDPALAIRLHRVLAAVMAERVALGNMAVATLLR